MTEHLPPSAAICNRISELTELVGEEVLEDVLTSLTKMCGEAFQAGQVVDMADVENAIGDGMAETGRRLLKHAFENLDDKAPRILIDGKPWHRVSSAKKRVVTKQGFVEYWRSCYRRRGERRQRCPVDEAVGLVGNCMTRPAASDAVHTMTGKTVREAEESIARLGNMEPSQSMLLRVMESVNERWQGMEPEALDAVADGEEMPEKTAAGLACLDGAMLAVLKREEGASESGWREVSCGTFTCLDEEGKQLSSVYHGRMPERNKVTLKRRLTREIQRFRERCPDLPIVGIADGAVDNWTWLEKQGFDRLALDYWHAVDKLWDAVQHAGRPTELYERLKGVLLEKPDGVERVIRSLRYQRLRAKTVEVREEVERVLGYFRKFRHRMPYHSLRQEGLPVGSGVVEAANKTLFNVRMKRSGMRWSMAGGQAVMTFRALVMSRRYDAAWGQLTDTLVRPIANSDRPCDPLTVAA
ncbi:MAG: hypothetical protein OXB95_05225 [Rhodobacteraceae bacterium]|nr:hypothetical protein [Paracoccaceae bacterium]